LVPDYETLMLPLLELLADGRERTAIECREALTSRFGLTLEDLSARIPSGANLFGSRLHWASTYLVKSGVLMRPRRGVLQLTDRGRALLSESPKQLDTTLLAERYEEMRSWRRVSRQRVGDQIPAGPAPSQDALSPEEALAANYQQIRDTVEADILERAKGMPPERFEKLVLDLLLKLGYGGPFGSGVHLGKSGDGGVDGVIQQDKLGLELIYVQAKRWQGSVGPSTVREFAGSLSAHRARKGVIITTSSFTAEARKDAERMGDRIVLIDGAQLAALMYEVGLGVSVASTFELKRPDSDYFEATD
jgi:restriction system protein